MTVLAFTLAWLAWRLVWNAWHWQPLAGAVLVALILLGALAQVRTWRTDEKRRQGGNALLATLNV